MKRFHSPGLSAGFSMVEILVSVVILTLGLLALAGMQLFALKSSTGSYHRSQAAVYARDMQDRMIANVIATNTGAYALTATTGQTAPATTADCSAGACSTAEMASWDLALWYTAAAAVLPSFRASISCSASPCAPASIHTITVMWDESDQNANPATGVGCSLWSTSDRFCYQLRFDI